MGFSKNRAIRIGKTSYGLGGAGLGIGDSGGVPCLGGPYAVIQQGGNFQGNAGSNASLDDLPNGANGFTFDGWLRRDAATPLYFAGKGQYVVGWLFVFGAGLPRVTAQVWGATDSATAEIALPAADSLWHHYTLSFRHLLHGGDGKIYLAIDGVWVTVYITQSIITSAYDVDNWADMWFGWSFSNFPGALGWCRLSNTNTRFPVGVNFDYPVDLPAADGNTVEAWSFAEGVGAVSSAQVLSPANDANLVNHAWEAVCYR